MSRKKHRNKSTKKSHGPQAGKTAQINRDGGKSLALVVGVVLLIGIMTAAVLYERGDTLSHQSETTARQAALASSHSPALGDPVAAVHIVEFIDPACGTCAIFYPIVKGWLAQNPGKLRLSIRHVAFHEGSDYVVRVLEASRKQDKYWQTLEALLTTQQQWVLNHVVQPDSVLPAIAMVGLNTGQLQTDMNAADVTQRIDQDQKDAVVLKVSATPEYYVNGRPLPSFGQQQLETLIREELQKAQ